VKLATVRTASGTAAARIEREQAVELGPADLSDILLPGVSDQVDWAAELGVVIGSALRRASAGQAAAAIAGYTIVNDVSMRDRQWRTGEWLQGKSFEASTPVGPWLVTPDEVDAGRLDLRCDVDGARPAGSAPAASPGCSCGTARC
jgi:2-keto-4-pentenoate hydratase/2-oxohepta-3-ene-1,7-dioic acid hydratase in catechol pathway